MSFRRSWVVKSVIIFTGRGGWIAIHHMPIKVVFSEEKSFYGDLLKRFSQLSDRQRLRDFPNKPLKAHASSFSENRFSVDFPKDLFLVILEYENESLKTHFCSLHEYFYCRRSFRELSSHLLRYSESHSF